MEAVKVGQRFTDVEARGKEKGKTFEFSILSHVTPLVRSLHEEVGVCIFPIITDLVKVLM